MTSTPVSAVSKRRLPLPSFTLRDQLCIASCVMRVGQGNWNTVARMAKQLAGMTLGADGEGLDRFSQRNCAAEYSRLEESSAAAAVSAHKRRRSELAAPSTGSAGSDTTAAQLVSKLTLERIEQLRAVVEQQKREIRTARVEAKAMEGEKQSNAQLCASIRSSYEKLGRPIPEDILKKIEAHEQQHNEQSSAPQTPSTAHASDAEVFSSPSRPPATAMIDAQKNELTSATPLQTAEIKCEADAAETVTATVAAPKPAPSPAVPRKSQGRPGRGSTSGAARVAPMELPLEFPTWDHYKQWKKEIVGCYREAASHRHANIFAYPVTDNIAPGYSSIILHPMDMSSIKRRIESGAICSTAQFEHAILEMWANAVMYNNSDTDVHKMAAEMAADTLAKLQTMLPRHFDYQPLTIPDVLRNKSDEFMLLSPEPEDEPTDSRSEVSSSSSKQRAVFGTPVSGTVKHLRSSHPHRGTRTSITTPQPKPVQETDTASTASRPAATPTSPPPPPAPSSNAGSDVETGSGQTRRRRRRISSSDDSDDVPLATVGRRRTQE